MMTTCFLYEQDDVMTWKCFLHYWPFVRGIHQWILPVDIAYKNNFTQSFDYVFDASLKNTFEYAMQLNCQ